MQNRRNFFFNVYVYIRNIYSMPSKLAKLMVRICEELNGKFYELSIFISNMISMFILVKSFDSSR